MPSGPTAKLLPVLTTDQKGAVAETAIAFAAIKLGIGVYRPLFEGGRFDFIFEVGGELSRVQCKWAPLHGDVVIVRCYSSRRARAGVVRRIYEPEDVDVIAAYCPPLDRCFVVPASRFCRPCSAVSTPRSEQEQPEDRCELGRRFRARSSTLAAARGRSSAGRASRWQREGHGFESRRLH